MTPSPIAAAIEQAVAAEREACAQLAEKSYVVSGSPGPLFDAGSRFTADLAAKSIRARGPTIDLAGAVRAYFEALDAYHVRLDGLPKVVEHEQRLRSLVQPGVEGGREV